MPIDPNIALQVRTPQPENILDSYGKAAQLKALIGQQKLLPEQLKAAQLENQTRQMQLGDVQAQNDAWKNAIKLGPDGSPTIDKDAVTNSLVSSGRGHLVPTVIKGFNEMEETAGKIREQKSKLSNEELDYAGTVGATAKAAGYDPDTLKIGLAHAASIYGPQSPSAQALQALQQDPSKAQVIADHLISQSPKQSELATSAATAAASTSRATSAATEADIKKTEEARKAELFPTEQRTKTAEANRAEADATLATAKANLTKLTPEQWTQQVDSIVDRKANPGLSDTTKSRVAFAARSGNVEAAQKALDAAAEEVSKVREATNPQIIAAKATTAAAEAAARSPYETQTAVNTERAKQQINAGGTLAQLGPAQRQIAQKLADGDFNPQELGRFPDKEALLAGAMEINPDWTRQSYATKKAFTDPQSRQSQNLGTISRIVEHIGRFDKNSDALGLSPSMLTGTNLTGTAAAVHQDAHAIASELEKLVSGGIGTEGQVKAWQSALTSSRPDIRKAAIDEISQLAGGQFTSMNQTYKAALGKDLPLDKFTSQNSREWLRKNGIDVGGGAASQPVAAHQVGQSVTIKGKPMKITKVYPDGTFDAQ